MEGMGQISEEDIAKMPDTEVRVVQEEAEVEESAEPTAEEVDELLAKHGIEPRDTAVVHQRELMDDYESDERNN